jgi:hypothetical protein
MNKVQNYAIGAGLLLLGYYAYRRMYATPDTR